MKPWILGTFLLVAGSALASDTPPEVAPSATSNAERAYVQSLLEQGDDIYRGASSKAVMTMDVVTAHYQRSMKMSVLSQGTEKTLLHILQPAKDAGIATLKVGDNLWNYLPKVDRTMKVPSGMMSGAWMGSHFSNDDLVHESRLSEDYTWTVTARPVDGKGTWQVKCVSKPDAAVVWGYVMVEIGANEVVRSMQYYDEHSKLVRTLSMSDIAEVGGRKIPMTMTMQPADKPNEHTRVHYDSITFDVELPATTFSLSALRP